MKYTVDIIRRDEAGLQFYLESYKPFRLLALQLSPEAFTSVYAECLAYADEAWIARSMNPRATTFVAIRQDGQVISSLTLVASEGNNQPASAAEPMSWHVNGVFTLPEARRKGVASAVMARAKRFAQDEAEARNRGCVLVLAVLAANADAKILYEKLGFKVKTITETEIEMVFEP